MKRHKKTPTEYAENVRVDDAEEAFRKTEDLARRVLSVPKSEIMALGKSKKRRKRA